MVKYNKGLTGFLLLQLSLLLFIALPLSAQSCLHSYPLDEVDSFTIFNNTYVVAVEKRKVTIFQSKLNIPIVSFLIDFGFEKMEATSNFLIFTSALEQRLYIYKISLNGKSAEFVGIYGKFEGNLIAIEPSVYNDRIFISDGKSVYLIDLESCSLIKKLDIAKIRRIHLYKSSLILINEKLNLLKLSDFEEEKKNGLIYLAVDLEIEIKMNSIMMNNLLIIIQKKSIYFIDIEKTRIIKKLLVEQEFADFEPTILSNLEFLIYMSVEGNLKYLALSPDSFEEPEEIFMNIPNYNGSLVLKEFGKGALLLKNRKISQYNLSAWPVNLMNGSACEVMCHVPSCMKCQKTNLTQCLSYNKLFNPSCPQTCSSCGPNATCTVCVPGYQLFGKECLKIKDCLPGEYQEIGKNAKVTCEKCSAGCLNCVNFNECQACDFEYQLYQGICLIKEAKDNVRSLHSEGGRGERENDDDDGPRNNGYNNNIGNSRSENMNSYPSGNNNNNYYQNSKINSSSGSDGTPIKTIGIIAGSVVGALILCFCLARCFMKYKNNRMSVSEVSRGSERRKLEETTPSTPNNIAHSIVELHPENQVKLNTIVLPDQAKKNVATDEEKQKRAQISIPKGIPAEGSKLKEDEKNQTPVMGMAIDFIN